MSCAVSRVARNATSSLRASIVRTGSSTYARAYRPIRRARERGGEALRARIEMAIWIRAPMARPFGSSSASGLRSPPTCRSRRRIPITRHAAPRLFWRAAFRPQDQVGARFAEQSADRSLRCTASAPARLIAAPAATPGGARLLDRLEARGVPLELFDNRLPANWADFAAASAPNSRPLPDDRPFGCRVLRLFAMTRSKRCHQGVKSASRASPSNVCARRKRRSYRCMVKAPFHDPSRCLCAGLVGFFYADLDTPMFIQLQPWTRFSQRGSSSAWRTWSQVTVVARYLVLPASQRFDLCQALPWCRLVSLPLGSPRRSVNSARYERILASLRCWRALRGWPGRLRGAISCTTLQATERPRPYARILDRVTTAC